MSLVGTRPPTLDEWEKYELHHRARLAIKPGIIVTYRCNARCSMCNRYKAPSKQEEEISIETIKKLPKR